MHSSTTPNPLQEKDASLCLISGDECGLLNKRKHDVAKHSKGLAVVQGLVSGLSAVV